jgi:hypothetical protein
MKGKDQPFLRSSEVDAAHSYSEIANKYGIKPVLFLTGKCIIEEKSKIRKLVQDYDVEIGGHSFGAFKPRLPYKLSYRVFNLKNGPKFFQNYEIKKTVDLFYDQLGYDIMSWRDHGYRHDKNSRQLLAANGIKYFSDSLSNDMAQPQWHDGVIDVPINIIPDHDYVYHGVRKPGSINENILKKSVFQTGAMDIEVWFEKIKKQIICIEKVKGLATILVHPACMEIVDNFVIFKELCAFLSQFESIKMNEINI